MFFNKIKTNRKRKGSISVVLIIMLFGSILMAVNMETVQTAKNIERVELADVITDESGGGGPGPSHNFGDATWMDGYWQYADGTVVYRNIQEEFDWTGNWISRYILEVCGSGYAARQIYLSNGDIAWYFTVYDASYPDGHYILSPSYDGSFYLKGMSSSNYDEYGNSQSGYYEWNPVDNTVTYSSNNVFYYYGEFKDKRENWIKNTETGDITFSAYTYVDVNGMPSYGKRESFTRNAETGEYEYTVTNTTYEPQEVTVPGHYEQYWRHKYIFHEDPLSGDIKINDDTGEPILDGNGNYIYGWREYLYDETGMPIEESYDVWIDEYSYTDYTPVEETTTATYPGGELPPDVTNPFDGVDIGNGAFPAIPVIPPDCTDLPWNF